MIYDVKVFTHRIPPRFRRLCAGFRTQEKRPGRQGDPDPDRYAALCLASTRRALYAAGQEEASLCARLEAVERENRKLNQRISEGWSAEELEALARERLGLVLPGDRIFRFTSGAQEEP